jgi:Flp pilus assembly protein TadB
LTLSLLGALCAASSVACMLFVPLGPARPLRTTRFAHPDAAPLEDAGWRWSLLRWETLRLGLIALGVLVGHVIGVGFLGAAAGILPSVMARTRASARRDRAARETVSQLQLALAALRSGTGLPEALRAATTSCDELAARPFARALREFDLGASLDRAIRTARADTRDRRVITALDAVALAVAEQLPVVRCSNLLASCIDRLVFEQRTLDELHAKTSGLRAQVFLLAALVPVLALYLAVSVPGLSGTLLTPLGRFVLLPLALTLEIIGVYASGRVVRTLS